MMIRKKKYLLCGCVLLALLSCKSDPLPDKEDNNDGIEAIATNTWFLNSFADIDKYKTENPQNRTSLRLLKNEYESVQLVIETPANETYQIERDGNTSVLEFDCRKVAVYQNRNDVLVPCNNAIKAENKLIKVWLTFKSSQTAQAGTYKEIIRFKNVNRQYAVALNITIEEGVLPEISSIPSVFGINPANIIATGLSETQKTEKRKEISDLLLSYRISPYFSSWMSGTMKTEVNSSPYPWNDDRTWSYLKDKRFGRIALPYHSLSDAELGTMLSRAKQEGLLDKVYFYVWDEPTKTSEYDQIKIYADRIHRYAPEAKVLTSFYRGPEDGDRKDDLFGTFDLLTGATGIFCTGVWSLQGSETRSQQCRAKLRSGEEWWCYVCMADKPGLAQNSSGIPNRVVMWRLWKEQASGFLYWVVNGFASMSPLKTRPELPEGDGILVYPGEPFGASNPCVSVRLERWREGAEDYEMLQLYAKKNGRDAALTLLNNVYKNPSTYTDNIQYMESFKKKLIDGIIK